MALTEQQKAENKAAQRVRNKAHRARYLQLNTALETAESLPQVLKAQQEFNELDTLFGTAIEKRGETERALRVQISQLEARH